MRPQPTTAPQSVMIVGGGKVISGQLSVGEVHVVDGDTITVRGNNTGRARRQYEPMRMGGRRWADGDDHWLLGQLAEAVDWPRWKIWGAARLVRG
jgi:hypothetical protein